MRKLPRAFLIMITGAASLLLMLALHAVAFAGPEGATLVDSSSAAKFADIALQILIPVVTVFAMWGANKVIRLVERKLGVDIPERQERAINDWVEQGIHFAEEKSRSKIKEKANKLRGPEKLEIALGFVLGMINSNGWHTWTRDKVVAKIEGSLGAHRANGGKPRLDAEGSPDLPDPS